MHVNASVGAIKEDLLLEGISFINVLLNILDALCHTHSYILERKNFTAL